MRMSSTQVLNVVGGPLGLSYPMRIRLMVRPAATAPMTDCRAFHCIVHSVLDSPCACGLSTTPCWSVACRSDRYVPSEKARSTAT